MSRSLQVGVAALATIVALLLGLVIGDSRGASSEKQLFESLPTATAQIVIRTHSIIKTRVVTRDVAQVVHVPVYEPIHVPVYEVKTLTRTIIKYVKVVLPTATPLPATATPKPSSTPQPTAAPAQPTATPQPPSGGQSDGCDPTSGVCATASNLHQDSGGSFDSLPQGQDYAVVHVKLVNNGSQSYDYNELDFILKGADTNVDYQPGALDTNISNTDLNSGVPAQ